MTQAPRPGGDRAHAVDQSASAVPSEAVPTSPPAEVLDALDTAARVLDDLDSAQLSRVGTTVANVVSELNSAATIETGGEPGLFLSGKVLRGWLAQITLAISDTNQMSDSGGPHVKT